MLESGLVPGPVVERFDVVEQDRAQFRAGDVAPVAVKMMDLAFERRPDGFHRSVIEAIADRPV